MPSPESKKEKDLVLTCQLDNLGILTRQGKNYAILDST